MIVDTGLSVTRRTWFRIASPLFGSLVSTSTTPAWVTNTVVFPPAPGITYRLSRTFLIVPVGGIRGRCCSAAAPATARPTTTSAGRSLLRAISELDYTCRGSGYNAPTGRRQHATATVAPRVLSDGDRRRDASVRATGMRPRLPADDARSVPERGDQARR